MADNIKNPRGAGRKPLPASEKRKILGVVLPPAMYKYVQNMAESDLLFVNCRAFCFENDMCWIK